MIDEAPAWANAIDAMPIETNFMADLAMSVSNSGCRRAAARWLLTLGAKAQGLADRDYSPWTPFDAFIYDFERIALAWGGMRIAAWSHMFASVNPLPSLARYIAERLPALWTKDIQIKQSWHSQVTRGLVLAERSHDLVGFWSLGITPTGSKDPFALRRAANHWIIAACSGRGRL